jgi:hypothetical protein
MLRGQLVLKTLYLPENVANVPDTTELPHTPCQWQNNSSLLLKASCYNTQLDATSLSHPSTPIPHQYKNYWHHKQL